MSEKRYTKVKYNDRAYNDCVMELNPSGEWVKYSDYQALEAERDELLQKTQQLEAERDRYKAALERIYWESDGRTTIEDERGSEWGICAFIVVQLGYSPSPGRRR